MRKIPDFYKEYLAKPNETLYDHTKDLLMNLEKLNEITPVPYKNMIETACIYHDIGKMNPLFSERLRSGKKFDEKIEIGHNILSFYLFYYLNQDFDLTPEELSIVAYAILNHHSYVDNFEVIEEKADLILKNLDLILKEKNGIYFKERKLRRVLDEVGDLHEKMFEKLILVKGMLHKCDYSASAHTEIEIGEYNLKERLETLHYSWNEMQNFAYESRENNLIIIGSTGLGKTEAALRWMDNHKGFYVLPLRTAINSMFLRLKNDLYQEDYDRKIALLHGDAKSVLLNQLERRKEIEIEPKEESKVWDYFEVSKSMALPLTITTPDQLFTFVFKYPGYELTLATFSYSKVVIDEIQAYNSRLLAFMIYGIQNIAKMGGKVAIITATLSPFIRDLLNRSYDEEGNQTKFDFRFKEKVFINPISRHKVKLLNKRLEAGDIIDFIKDNDGLDSMKVLVVMNTVKAAQKLYKELKEISKTEIEIKLLHARYIFKDRSKKEKEILADGERFVKKKVVWIATQIVEASLDIDFDCLFTEFSELNSFFQRIGRANRAGLKGLDRPNIYVYLEIDRGILGKDFIDESLYELGKVALREWESRGEGILSEEDKLSLINSYYTTENMRNSEFFKRYREHYREISLLTPNNLTKEAAEKLLRNIFSIKCIPISIYQENEEEMEELDRQMKECKNRLSELYRRVKILNVDCEEERREIKNRIKREKLNLVEWKDKVNQFCVNLGFFKGMNLRNTKKIGGEDIIIANGNYSEELGFTSEEENKGEGIFI